MVGVSEFANNTITPASILDGALDAKGDWSTHADPTSGLQTYGDANWATATGFSTHDAVAVRDAILDRVLSDNHDVSGTVGAVLQYLDALISSRSSHTAEEAKADVSGLASQASVDALNDFDPTAQEVTTDTDSRDASKADVSLLALEATSQSIKGETDKIGTLTEDSAGLRYTAKALEQGPVATGFAVAGDPMTLTPAERTAIKDALEAVGGKLDTAYRRRSRIREETDGWYWDIIDGNGDVVVTHELNEIISDVPAFDRTGAEPNA